MPKARAASANTMIIAKKARLAVIGLVSVEITPMPPSGMRLRTAADLSSTAALGPVQGTVATPRACVAGIAVGAIPFQRCQADGSSRGVSAGGEFLDRFGGQRLAADAPFAAGYFGDLHPRHPPHVLASIETMASVSFLMICRF